MPFTLSGSTTSNQCLNRGLMAITVSGPTGSNHKSRSRGLMPITLSGLSQTQINPGGEGGALPQYLASVRQAVREKNLCPT